MREVPAYVQDQLSILTDCASCIKQDARCAECQDELDVKQTVRAYELVDEGSLQYTKVWLQTTEPTAHDWVGSLVRLPDGRVREEFLEPVVHMEDRIMEPILDVASRETICSSCHLVCWAELPCPNCEEVNA